MRYLPSLLLDDLLHLRHLLLHLRHLLARVPALLRHRLHPHRLHHLHPPPRLRRENSREVSRVESSVYVYTTQLFCRACDCVATACAT